MTLEDAFNRWRDGEFSDDEVSGFTGLTPRALRDLAKWGAIETAGGEKGRGKRRAWKRRAICKAAMTAAFHRAGLSLPMSARLAFHYWNLPNLMRVMNYDPMIRFPTWEKLEIPVLSEEKREGGEHALKAWFTEDFSFPRRDPDFDSLVHIVNGAFIIFESAIVPHYRSPAFAHVEQPFFDLFFVPVGRLSDDGSRLLSWVSLPVHRTFTESERAEFDAWHSEMKAIEDRIKGLSDRIKEVTDWRERDEAIEELNNLDRDHKERLRTELPKFGHFPSPLEQYGSEVNFDFLQYEVEAEGDREKAKSAFHDFEAKTSVNVTLAMRMAMRRAMNLPMREL